MRFGVCLGDLKGDDHLPSILKRVGCNYLELGVETVKPEESKEEFAEVKEKIRRFSLAPEAFNCFIPPNLKLVGGEVDFARVTRYVQIALSRIAELRGKIVVFGSGGARKVPDGFPRERAHEQLIKFLNMVADEAGKQGITIALEPLFKVATNIINSVREGLELVKKVGRKEILLLADLFHMGEEKESFSSLEEAKDYLVHIHIPVPGIEGVEVKKSYDHQGFLKKLEKIGYEGRVSVEDNGGSFHNFEEECSLVLHWLKSSQKGGLKQMEKK